MAASQVTTYSYSSSGPTPRASPRRPVELPAATTPGSESRAILSKSARRAWETEPLELQRDILRLSAIHAGIAGRTGTYAEAAQRTGFARELQRIAGPRELGPLAQAYARAWGKSMPNPPSF